MNVVRRVLTAVAGTWTARGYLALCGALLIWAAFDTAFVDHEDASFAALWPLLATAPTSVLLVFLPPAGNLAGYVLLISVAALVNAAVLNWCVRAMRRSGSTTGAR
ncbi:hypothetical protein CUT44_23110 [Streptomyces carminius]|uniref:Uncharacterized protein n=1 Tax=Streptomyces carminius TaxID=2665496 RepID=A0A2M8LU72_9ACTN|nr:hypothetical protein [Streptomyces carminius]PJE95494.1 hypothetical protein CUT44_23110 [Streptomyces carminius]